MAREREAQRVHLFPVDIMTEKFFICLLANFLYVLWSNVNLGILLIFKITFTTEL